MWKTENHGLFDGSNKVFLMVSPKGHPDLVSFFGQRKCEIEMISTRTTHLLQVNLFVSLLKQPAPFFHPKQAHYSLSPTLQPHNSKRHFESQRNTQLNLPINFNQLQSIPKILPNSSFATDLHLCVSCQLHRILQQLRCLRRITFRHDHLCCSIQGATNAHGVVGFLPSLVVVPWGPGWNNKGEVTIFMGRK